MSTILDRDVRCVPLAEDVEDYVRGVSRPDHMELTALRTKTAAMPFVAMMQGSPSVSQLLQFLIRLTGAANVLEVGVFTGCSTLGMAMALPAGGRIVAMDVSERWPAIGREFWVRGGCADRIDLRIGPAVDVLDALIGEGLANTFDLAFIDANKDGYWDYFDRCLTLVRQNGVIVFDNVLFGGRVHPLWTETRIRQDGMNRPKSLQDLYVRYVEGLRCFNERIACDQRVDVVVLPMLDGVTLARKR